jgi:hypothetical protein
MEKNDKAEELINSISRLESMEEVPAEVSVRFHETLSRLASQESKKTSMLSRLTGTNQVALAASFVLVFALGAVVTLNTGDNLADPLGVVKPQSSASPSSTDISDDQIQYSGGDNSIPASSPVLVKQTASLKEYTEIPMDFYKKLGVGSTWNSAANLDKVILECLKKLELTDSTNLIDSGIFQGKSIKAIWVPITGSSWNVYLIDSSCVALDKKFVQG